MVTRRTVFELRKAEERLHILDGLKIALDNLDAVIKLIRAAKDPATAKAGLVQQFQLSEIQAQAILDMRLQRLTGLERDKILEERDEMLKQIARSRDPRRRARGLQDHRAELLEVKKLHGDERRTEIVDESTEISIEDMIVEEDMVVTISHEGYIKRNAVSLYRAQRRGGRGKIGATTKEEDFVEHLFVASTHSYILFFTTTGKVYWIKVHELPQAGRAARGKAIVNLLNLEKDEKISAFLPVREFQEGRNIFFATKNGTVKKTELMAYSNPRKAGIIAISLDEGDEVIGVRLTDGQQERDSVDAQGPGDPLQGGGRAAHGTRRGRRARHLAGGRRQRRRHRRRQPGRHAARRRRARLRQAHGDGRVPAQRARRQGHHHHEDHRQDRAGGRRAHGHRRRRHHAGHRRRQGDPHPGARHLASSAATRRACASSISPKARRSSASRAWRRRKKRTHRSRPLHLPRSRFFVAASFLIALPVVAMAAPTLSVVAHQVRTRSQAAFVKTWDTSWWLSVDARSASAITQLEYTARFTDQDQPPLAGKLAVGPANQITGRVPIVCTTRPAYERPVRVRLRARDTTGASSDWVVLSFPLHRDTSKDAARPPQEIAQPGHQSIEVEASDSMTIGEVRAVLQRQAIEHGGSGITALRIVSASAEQLTFAADIVQKVNPPAAPATPPAVTQSILGEIHMPARR